MVQFLSILDPEKEKSAQEGRFYAWYSFYNPKVANLEGELGTAPVATLVVVTDGVISLKTDPLGDGAVLAHLLAQGELEAELLVGRLCKFDQQGSKRQIIVRKLFGSVFHSYWPLFGVFRTISAVSRLLNLIPV